jgi:transposase InsO family protein
MVEFIDQHRQVYGVESICRQLPIAPSTYYESLACRESPQKRSIRARRDDQLREEIHRVWESNYSVYGYRKVWRQLIREGFSVARCTVARLMKNMGIEGVRRGRNVKTTVSVAGEPCPLDLLDRQFVAERPNQLWVADFTFVATRQGFVYVAFVIDTFANRIVGWKASSSAQTEFVLDALEQALHDRNIHDKHSLIHHNDRGSQYVSIAYTERLKEAGINPSVGSVGDSYDNALAETINGLYKTELVYNLGPWRSIEQLELATLKWVHWFNHVRLMGPIGDIPPVELEQLYEKLYSGHAIAA